MPIPSSMSDLSTVAASNSPAGSESPISTDDFHRAIQAILRHTNAKGLDIASAASIDLGAATGEFVDVTGTTTITSLGTVAAGIVRTVRFTGILTLTYNATSLILPTATSITTAAGDVAIFRSLGSGNWLCVNYIRASGQALLIADNAVTTAKILDANVTQPKLATALRLQFNLIQDFRLTLTSGLPITTADVSGATTIYCTPYQGNSIALYDGTNWNLRTSAEFSLALGTLTSGRPYDVFCYDNAGVPTLEFTAWTNDTTRATALVMQDGVLSKTGALTRRYLGTFYTTATTTTEDSAAKRFLWNYYNRVVRYMEKYDASASWTYTSAAYRQANGSTANQLDYVCGVAEDCVSASVIASASNTAASTFIQIAVGVDSTTTPSGPLGRQGQPANGVIQTATATYEGLPGVGRHFLTWLEYSAASGTQTWQGTNSPLKSGIIGKVMA
jgi:hypothetical protein